MKRLLRAAAVLAAALGLGATGVVVSNASQLPVTGGDISVGSVAHPCAGRTLAVTAAAPVTGTTSTVSVTTPADWPAACVGKRIDLVVADGAVTRTGFVAQAPAAGTPAPVTLDAAFTPTQNGVDTAATLAGWSLATSWAYTPAPPTTGPVEPGTPYTDIRALTWTLPDAAPGGTNNSACFQVTVSTTNASGQQDWAVDIHTAQRPFNGATTGYWIDGSDAGRVRFQWGTPTNGVITIEGVPPDHKLRASQSLTFRVCNANLPAPPDVPSAYQVVYSQGTWTSTQACMRATVTGNGSSLFPFGWSAPIDMTPAFERIRSAGLQVGRVQQVFSDNIATITPAPSPSIAQYTVRSGAQGFLRLSQSRTVDVCAYQY